MINVSGNREGSNDENKYGQCQTIDEFFFSSFFFVFFLLTIVFSLLYIIPDREDI